MRHLLYVGVFRLDHILFAGQNCVTAPAFLSVPGINRKPIVLFVKVYSQ